jgi:hypothetical protein
MIENTSFHEEKMEDMMVFPDGKSTFRSMGRAVPPDRLFPPEKESMGEGKVSGWSRTGPALFSPFLPAGLLS